MRARSRNAIRLSTWLLLIINNRRRLTTLVRYHKSWRILIKYKSIWLSLTPATFLAWKSKKISRLINRDSNEYQTLECLLQMCFNWLHRKYARPSRTYQWQRGRWRFVCEQVTPALQCLSLILERSDERRGALQKLDLRVWLNEPENAGIAFHLTSNVRW